MFLDLRWGIIVRAEAACAVLLLRGAFGAGGVGDSDGVTFRWFSGDYGGGSNGRTERASVHFFADFQGVAVAGQKDAPNVRPYIFFAERASLHFLANVRPYIF